EAADDGGPRGGDGGLLVGAARPHLQAGPAVGGGGHPGGGGGDGAVVVEDGEHDGLQEERLGEGAAHGEDGRAGEEALPLAVADVVTAEAVVAEVLQGLLADDALLAQPRDLG